MNERRRRLPRERRTRSLRSAFLYFLLLLLPFVFRIPSDGPLRSFRKPLVLQELPHLRSISRVELQNPKHKRFILVRDLSLTETLEGFHLLRRHHRHDAHDRFLCLLVRDLFIRDRKRPEPLVLVRNNLRIVHVIAFWLFRLEYMEIETPYKVDKLGGYQLPGLNNRMA